MQKALENGPFELNVRRGVLPSTPSGGTSRLVFDGAQKVNAEKTRLLPGFFVGKSPGTFSTTASKRILVSDSIADVRSTIPVH
jgi:hypothetical protein